MNFIWYILIGILAGYFAGKIMRGGGFGLLVNLLLGIIGGVLGGWVFALLGLAATGIIGSLITSVSLDSLLLQPLPVRGVFLATRQYRLLWLYKN